MSVAPPTQLTSLESFHRFIAQQLQTEAGATLTSEMALWRNREDTLAAIREGLADVAAGRTRPFKEFDKEFRARRGIEETR